MFLNINIDFWLESETENVFVEIPDDKIDAFILGNANVIGVGETKQTTK